MLCIAFLEALHVDYNIHFNSFSFPFCICLALFPNFDFLCLWCIVVALGTTKSASETGSENKESSNGQNEEETIEQILSFDKSAAAICVQLQKRSGTQITQIPFMKDIIGIVALLGKVDDDNLSRLVQHSIQ